MKILLHTLTTLSIISLSNLVNAQGPNWLWAKSAGSTGTDESYSIAVDANGNSYITGNFAGTSITFGSITLTNAGGGDIFIVKYDASGIVIWAKRAGGNDYDGGYAIAVDTNGNCYITGYSYSPTITFGNTTFTNPVNGAAKLYVVKYDTNGNVIWAKSAGVSTSSHYGLGIAVDVSGNCYATGYFHDATILFGSIILTNSGNGYDMYIVKYDSIGTEVWASSAGTNSENFGQAITVDLNGNSFVTGSFYGSIIFGNDTLISSGTKDLFIVKYNSIGTVIWAKAAGGGGSDIGNSIAVDINGNSYITGIFGDNITFGSTTLSNNLGPLSEDFFIVKYDATGTVLWAKSPTGGYYECSGNSIELDLAGNSYVTGYFFGSTITFGNKTLTNTLSNNLFVVKFDSNGNAIWAKTAVGNPIEGQGIAVNATGNNYITGFFSGSTITFGNTVLTKIGGSDIFIAKLDTSTITGIEEHQTGGTFNIAPNPFTSQTTISFIDEQKNTTIKIMDVLGKEIKDINFTGKQTILEKGDMQPGIYFVQTIDERKNMLNRKIIIE